MHNFNILAGGATIVIYNLMNEMPVIANYPKNPYNCFTFTMPH
jgi:hypothetical protein